MTTSKHINADTPFGRHRSSADGFTLIEVVVALGILASALVILLESHYGSLQLFDAAQNIAFTDQLMQHAIGESERLALTGELSGDGDFGARFSDYTYRFEAQPVSPKELPGLLEIKVSVEGPDGIKEMQYLMYNVNQTDGVN